MFKIEQKKILASYDLQLSQNEIYTLYYVQCILNVAGTAFEIFHHDFDCFDLCSNSTES